jgi:tripartite-type tricarboxylate transporter receptor subunit TctC
VTSAKRTAAAPEIPTIDESIHGYDATGWFGFLAPAGTPKSIVDRLALEIRKSVTSGALRDRMKATGNELEFWGSTPDEFRSYIAKEIPQWKAVVKAANITMD